MARVLISVPDDFLSKVDKIATNENRTRSELIREAMRLYMKKTRITDLVRAQNNANRLEKLL